ncbi:putative ribonuclease H-like domain-containing protein [Tanacetum coccineum]|uniref:Ribonuclease H-like domain-containing protein n=1 Tax=Tanacetum coccineum TaxID=301880 RepID=A0ABQ4WMI1_9ASTR
MPPKPNLLFNGLEDFTNEPIVIKLVVENSEAKASEAKPKAVRKNNGAPIIEDWVSDSEEENVSQTKIEKKTAKPSFVKIDFVKAKQTNKTDMKIAKQGNPQMDLHDKGVIDSGCSRHMTGNMSYLTDYEEIDGGYVAFGGNPKGGKFIGKGTIKTGNLDFENVYFVRELKFNLFSVSQMCDKKNSGLFNGTECIVLSPNFKLIDESQVLLRVPRKKNMYSVDLKNIVPKRGLTCLFAKATSDESKLWHRRLGHLNFKTINKLVKGNLVRGLPSKLLENDQTCVACQKGKQHKASCKSKTENSISLPLHLLHMDLFGPTFVKILIKKMYCLVVTDDYSRFTWVFFLATKDETSGILKHAVWNGIGVNAGDSKLMLLGITYCCWLVTFLAKLAESEGFEQIVDFLNAHTINLLDGKKIIITESIVKRDLQLEDAEGVDFLPNATIFEQLTLMGYEKISQKLTFYKAFFSLQWKFLIHTILQCLSSKTNAWNKFNSTVASAIICLATNQKFNFSKYIFESMVKNLDNVGKFLMYPSLVRAATTASSLETEQGSGNINKTLSKATPNDPSSLGTSSGGGPRRQETMRDTIARTRSKNVSKLSNDSLLVRGNTLRSGKDSLKRQELMALCTTLQSRVFNLETTKTTQANEIASLKRRVKKLEKKNKSRTHKLKRLYKVGLSAMVESSEDEESLGDDASKQGRRITDINDDEDITLVNDQIDTDAEMFDVDTLTGDEVLAEQVVAAKDVNLSVDEVTLAQALAALKSAKDSAATIITAIIPTPRKIIVFQEPCTTTTISSQQPSQANVQDKGKGKMIKPEKPMKKKELIRLDEEIALKFQAEFDEEVRLVREKAEKEQEANVALTKE